jgi:DNA-binding beta-propeller fold protein YncE
MTNSRGLLPAGGVKGGAWSLKDPSIPPYGAFYVGAQDALPQGVFFKPDGLKMYVLGDFGNAVYEYDLATAWDVSTASFLQTFSVSAQETFPTGVFFRDDGLKMYVIGSSGDDVNEYTLATAWDISTASFLQTFSVSAQEASPQGVFFKPDGLKMYVVGSSGRDVNEYNLATAWNVSTASFLQVFSVSAQESSPSGIFFKPDGLKMYVSGSSGDDVNEYNLATAWNVSTASFLQVFSVSAQETGPTGVFFRGDGLKMYVIGSIGDAVYEYNLATAWNVSTASWIAPAGSYFGVAAQDTSPQGVFFKPDGLKMYMIGLQTDAVREYNLATAWDISTASYIQGFSVSAQENFPTDVFFRDDGLKMYVVGTSGDDVNEYNLATAWDISTASFLQTFSFLAQEASPQGVFFKPDGLKMYVVGSSGDDVNEYNLATAWNVSTASFLQSFSVAAQETTPQGLFFKPDGLKMYVIGSVGDSVYEYNLATAWDISTASFVQSFSVVNEDSSPAGLFFKPDGKAMYIVGTSSRAVWAYSLT